MSSACRAICMRTVREALRLPGKSTTQQAVTIGSLRLVGAMLDRKANQSCSVTTQHICMNDELLLIRINQLVLAAPPCASAHASSLSAEAAPKAEYEIAA